MLWSLGNNYYYVLLHTVHNKFIVWYYWETWYNLPKLLFPNTFSLMIMYS